MSLLYAPVPVDFNSPAVSCDCLAHAYGNAAGHPDRVRRYPSDMTDAEWALVRSLLPVPAWLEAGRTAGLLPPPEAGRDLLPGRGRDLVAGDARGFPAWSRVYALFRRRKHGLIPEFHDRLRLERGPFCVPRSLGRDRGRSRSGPGTVVGKVRSGIVAGTSGPGSGPWSGGGPGPFGPVVGRHHFPGSGCLKGYRPPDTSVSVVHATTFASRPGVSTQ